MLPATRVKRSLASHKFMLPVSQLHSLLESNALAQLTQEFLEWFGQFRQTRMVGNTHMQHQKMEHFANIFLTLYVDDRYRIPQQFLAPFITFNPINANFIACTSLGTTDSWTTFKLAAPQISTLENTLSSSNRKLLFRIFGGPIITGLGAYQVYKQDILRALGEDNVEFPPPVILENYNHEMAKGDITLMAYPFAGFTTVIDSIHLGVPVITRRGNQGYNNFPAELLIKYNLEELIAYSEEEYIDNIVRLANDADYRHKLQSTLLQIDQPRILSEGFDGTVFERAIEYVLENHNPSKTQPDKPIVVK